MYQTSVLTSVKTPYILNIVRFPSAQPHAPKSKRKLSGRTWGREKAHVCCSSLFNDIFWTVQFMQRRTLADELRSMCKEVIEAYIKLSPW
jgi:hypothetical protein